MIPMLFDDDLPEDVRKALDTLHESEEWNPHPDDVSYLLEMANLYPDVSLYEEAVSWRIWMKEWREVHPRKRIQPRSRFRNWLKFANRRAQTGTRRLGREEWLKRLEEVEDGPSD